MATNKFWDFLRSQASSPEVNQDEIDRLMEKLHEQFPVPVFWLLGKTQSGKTSIVRALTGSTQAEIGNGFQPCTRTASKYSFPDEQEPFIEFLDTRGLGEVDYDASEDLALFQEQAHLLIVVMKALDHAQEPVMDAVKQIHARHPNWPIVVAQTSLHEGYPTPEAEHALPYPYQQDPLPSEVPSDLARSLRKQRELFAGMNAHFVPIDFTLPEDGYEPVHYGLDALWNTIEAVLPLGLRAIVGQIAEARQNFRDAHFRVAHPIIMQHAIAAGAAAAVPVPFVDIPAVLGIQSKMFYAIANVYKQPIDRTRIAEIAGALGMSYLGRLGVRGLAKFIPGIGSAVTSVYTAATTYALGRTLAAYFAYALDGDLPDQQTFQKIYNEQFKVGREKMQEYLKNMNREPQFNS